MRQCQESMGKLETMHGAFHFDFMSHIKTILDLFKVVGHFLIQYT